ncbi:MAG: hypothetical protein ACRCZE_00935 [Candidatus Altimarinota bacterium]
MFGKKSKNNSNQPLKRSNRIFWGILIVLAQLIILTIIGFFIWEKYWFKGNLAAFLPAEQTVALAELNLDANSTDYQQLRAIASNSPFFNFQLIEQGLSAQIPSYEQFKPLFYGRIGLAILQQTNSLQPAIFLEYKDRQQVIDSLNSSLLTGQTDQLIEEKIHGYSLFSFQVGQNYSALLLNNYLVVSADRSALQLIAETSAGQHPNLKKSASYQQVLSALPEQNLLIVFLDSKKLWSAFLADRQFLSANLNQLQTYLPFLKILSSEGISVRFENNQLIAQQLSLVNSEYLEGQPFLKFDQNFSATLFSALKNPRTFVYTGRGLYDEYNALKSIYSQKSTVDKLIFEGQIQQIKNSFFPDSSGFENLLLPLLNNQYLVFLDYSSATPRFAFALELSEPKNNFYDLDKALINNQSKFAQFKPVKQSFELPDKTIGERWVSLPENVRITSVQSTADSELKTIRIGAADDQNPLQIQYGLQNKYFLIANDPALYTEISSNLTADLPSQNLTFNGRIPQVDHYLEVDFSTLPKLSPLELASQLSGQSSFTNPFSAISTYFPGLSTVKYGRKYIDQGILNILEINFLN